MTDTKPPSVRTIGLDAPLRWLGLGWSDFTRTLGPSLVYGALVAAISTGLWLSLIRSNLAFWALALSCGFVFVAPMMAMGLYEAGRMLERGERPTLGRMLLVRQAFRVDVFYLGLALLFIYLLWGRIAQIVYGLSTYRLHRTVAELTEFALTTPEGTTMLISGTIVGGVLAFFTFALVAVSAPMLLNRDTGVFGAAFTSLSAVAKNFAPMLLWAILITLLLLVAASTAWVALIVVFPWLGFASWRAYRDVVESG
jgi:uncharacterized membrane protein